VTLSTAAIDLSLLPASAEVQAQDERNHAARHHPPQDRPLHEILFDLAHARSSDGQLLQ
jgi:hypothetical protein